MPTLKPKSRSISPLTAFTNRHFVADGFDVLILVFHFLAGPLPSGLEAGLPRPDDDDVVAHVHERVHDASAEALAVGEQDHDGSQSPDDAEHGEQGAQAVAHERLPALRNEFFQVHFDSQSGRNLVKRFRQRESTLLNMHVSRSGVHSQQRPSAVHFAAIVWCGDSLTRPCTVVMTGWSRSMSPELVLRSTSNAASDGRRR